MTATTQQTARAAKHWRAGQKAAKDQQWATAAREFEQAVKWAPRDAGAWHDLAVSQSALAQLPQATLAARRAFELAPDSLVACKTLVELLMRQNRHGEAADAAAALAPATAADHELMLAHASALLGARRPAEAVPAFLKALALDLTDPIAHFRMGLAFKDLQRDHDANLCFRTALATDRKGGAHALILSQLVYGSRLAAEWQDLESDTAALLKAIDAADDAVGAQLAPFSLLAIEATPAQQLHVGRLATQALARHIEPLPAPPPRRPGKVRVGYLSADFCNHATALLLTELLERRDRGRFEVFLYSHSIEDGSDIQRRVRAAGDHWIDVTEMADRAVAERIRADGIDIMVDLKGHTRDSRFHLLAYRPAPVQLAYLGYPGPSGADFIDYLVGDAIVTPLAHAAQYSEKIAQLPHCYQPNDRNRALPPAPARADEGLPEDAVVLCCFNQTYKISPRMLDLWARILAGAPNTVLWMLTWTAHGHLNLARELAARGVDLDRVLFAPKVSVEEHIARLRCADLFLDTWPCNAHTTASEALWAGVPVLTVPGATYASRVAASLVAACGQPEMACADEEAYVQAAIRLAGSPQALRAAKAHLEDNRMTLPLFDSDRYGRDYEALLLRMFDRHQAGLPPEHLPAAEATTATAGPATPAAGADAAAAADAVPAAEAVAAGRIPKTIHIIWVGDESKRPDNCIRTWVALNPSWTVKVWGNAQLAETDWINARHMRAMAGRELNGVADMMRWEILYNEGGFVVDADSLCVRPLDDSLLDCEAFACWENEVARPGLIAAGYFACAAGNPFVGQIIKDIHAQASVVDDMAWKTVGPLRLTESHLRYAYTGLTVLPSHFFIPEHFTGVSYQGGGRVYARQEWASTKRGYDALHLKRFDTAGREIAGTRSSAAAPARAAPRPLAPAAAVAPVTPAPAAAMRSPLEDQHAPYFVQRVRVSRELVGRSRIDAFSQICAGRRVLHMGCADWPITDPKTSLHLALEPHCERLDGFDVHAEALAGLAPHARGRLYSRLEDVTDEYDLILVPEVMEHVADVGGFLAQLHALKAPRVLITVPDAYQCRARHFDYVEGSETFVEVVHPDHNCWYTPYTLTNVIKKYTPWHIDGIWFFNHMSLLAVATKPAA